MLAAVEMSTRAERVLQDEEREKELERQREMAAGREEVCEVVFSLIDVMGEQQVAPPTHSSQPWSSLAANAPPDLSALPICAF